MAILMEHLENLVKRASMPYDPAATQQTLSAAANMAKPPGAPSMPTMPEPGKDSGNSDATRMAELKFKMEQAQQKLNEKNEKEKVVLQGRLERAQQEIENQKAQRALERQHLSNLEKLRAKEDSLKSKEAEIEHQKVLAQASIAEEQANARAEVAQQRADATAAVAQSQADATASLAEQEAKRYVKTTEDAKKSIDKYRDAQLQTIAGKQQELDNKRNGISPLVQNSIARMQNRVKNMSRIRTKLQAMPGVYMSEVHAGDEPIIQKKATAVPEQNSVVNQAKNNPTVPPAQAPAQAPAQGSQVAAPAQAPTEAQARLARQQAIVDSLGNTYDSLKASREAASFERTEAFRQMLTGEATGATSMLGDLDGLNYKDREVRRAELYRNGQYAKEYAAYLRGDKNINLEGNPFVEMAKSQNLTADEVFTAAQQAQNMAAGWEKDNIAYGKTVEEAAANNKAKMQELNDHRDMMDKRWDETTQSYKTGYDQLRMTQNDKRYAQDRYWQDKASEAYDKGFWGDVWFNTKNFFGNDSYNQWNARNRHNGDGFFDTLYRSATGTEKEGDAWGVGYWLGAPAGWLREGVTGVRGLFGGDTTANRQIWDNQHQRDIAAKRYNADTSLASNFFETDNPQNKAYYDALHRKGISGSTWGGLMDQWRGNVSPILSSAGKFAIGGLIPGAGSAASTGGMALLRAGAGKVLNGLGLAEMVPALGQVGVIGSNALLGTNFDMSGGGLFSDPYQREQLSGVLGTGALSAQDHYDLQRGVYQGEYGVQNFMEDQAAQSGLPTNQVYQYYGYQDPQQMTKASSTPTTAPNTAPSSQNIQLPTAADTANSYRVNTSMDHWAPRETGALEGLINSYGPTVVNMLGLQSIQLPNKPYQADYTDLHHQTLRGMVNPFDSKYLVNRPDSTSDTGRAIMNFVRQERQGSSNPMTMYNGAVRGLMGNYNTAY